MWTWNVYRFERRRWKCFIWLNNIVYTSLLVHREHLSIYLSLNLQNNLNLEMIVNLAFEIWEYALHIELQVATSIKEHYNFLFTLTMYKELLLLPCFTMRLLNLVKANIFILSFYVISVECILCCQEVCRPRVDRKES